MHNVILAKGVVWPDPTGILFTSPSSDAEEAQ